MSKTSEGGTPASTSQRPGDSPAQAPESTVAPPASEPPNPAPRESWVKRLFLGGAKDVQDPKVFHTISLAAFMAWVGLGADGLSSSAYGPEEAFKALGEHTYLAVVLAVAIGLTVFIISSCYTQVIEQFPFGGGGYVVASRLLGGPAGVVSGSALIVDYVLTIAISIAAGTDAVFSFLPQEWQGAKVVTEVAAIGVLGLMNLRGVKESVAILTPIFLLFLGTHVALIVGTFGGRALELPAVVQDLDTRFSSGLATLGLGGMFALFFRAYSMGAGTFTGIEGVSNGLNIMREPRVETGKKTMALIAVSLAITAAGIIFCYLLVHATPEAGKTMNAVWAERVAGGLSLGGFKIGHGFVIVSLLAEGMLLFVAAQAGFIAGPRVMANMASDSWLPHRFAQLSDRLTMQNGVLLMCGASLLAVFYTRGEVSHLVVMYSINVFVTFSLSLGAMCRYWYRARRRRDDWSKKIRIQALGLVLCLFILVVTVYEKFEEGGWVTLVVTGALIGLCFWIRSHYRQVQRNLKRLDEILKTLPTEPGVTPAEMEPQKPTAVLMVGSYAGLGVHSLLTIQRLFPNYYKNFVFLSVGVIDSATFKGVEEVEEVERKTERALKKYVELAQGLGLPATYRFSIGTEAVVEAEELSVKVAKEFPRAMFFAGKLVFEEEKWFQRILHNETAYQLQRRLQFAGLNAMVLPVRVLGAAH